ncbi:MAG: exonuclease SbcCD subunit D, partial [Anaerolineae bacterium]|nr:exonuclease SbcCD subunit D [Anaerolineae bacterium]
LIVDDVVTDEGELIAATVAVPEEEDETTPEAGEEEAAEAPEPEASADTDATETPADDAQA